MVFRAATQVRSGWLGRVISRLPADCVRLRLICWPWFGPPISTIYVLVRDLSELEIDKPSGRARICQDEKD